MSLDPSSLLTPPGLHTNLPEQSIASLARAVAGAADEVRHQVGVVGSAAGAEWAGPASRRFRAALGDRAHQVGACATALDDLAAVLSAHAAASARASASLP